MNTPIIKNYNVTFIDNTVIRVMATSLEMSKLVAIRKRKRVEGKAVLIYKSEEIL